ncbi:hypothetical protein HII36_48845 [Nonomuraea sp. NN258]|uniref:hypothetical protein n=1 Tax=Nonomuraea antri TaxID=2730852 RepID=UPI0015680E21|nr:hypothetical protein [Nonomuraea antri]NRQ39688.1 hypothetical protein [Nonomuraea antri]
MGTTARRSMLAGLAAVLLWAGLPSGAGAQSGAAFGWTPVGTVDPQHVSSADTQLVLYGVHAFTPNNVAFNPSVIPASVAQLVVPYVAVPDGNPHTYRLRFHLDTTAPAGTQYQLITPFGGGTETVNVSGGAVTLDFTVSVDLAGAGWRYWSLKNSGGHSWVFTKCEIDEQTP